MGWHHQPASDIYFFHLTNTKKFHLAKAQLVCLKEHWQVGCRPISLGATGQNQIRDERATKKNILPGGPSTRYNLGYNSYN